jgi:hypothetical protein
MLFDGHRILGNFGGQAGDRDALRQPCDRGKRGREAAVDENKARGDSVDLKRRQRVLRRQRAAVAREMEGSPRRAGWGSRLR